MFSDLNFYKIVKVKRKVNENVMIRKLQFCGLLRLNPGA